MKKNKSGCFTKYIKHRLRDKIAHVDFEIDENGDFFKHIEKGKKLVDIVSEWNRYVDFFVAVINEMTQVIKEHTPNKI